MLSQLRNGLDMVYVEQNTLERVRGEHVWHGPAMLARRDEWTHALPDEAIAELDAVISRVASEGISLLDISRNTFEMPVLRDWLVPIRQQLQRGIAFALIRGLPVHRYDRLAAAAAYFTIGAFLGDAVSQNAKGHALGHVRDIGVDPRTPTGRGYQSAFKLNFHTDPTDVVGLLCLNKAKSGGESAIVSAAAVYNTMLDKRPDLVHVLTQILYRDRRGEIPEGREPWYRLPVFNFRDGHLLTNYVRSTIDKAQRFPEVPRLTETQLAAFALIEETTTDPDLYLQMSFEPGDIQLLNNHFIMHSRTAFEDYAEPDRKRHLLRLWLACDDGPPLPKQYFEFMDATPAGRPNGYHMKGVPLSTPLMAEDGGPGSSAQRTLNTST